MSNRGLYPTLSEKKFYKDLNLMMNLISLCDGENSLIEIAEILNLPIWDLYEIVDNLLKLQLIDESN